MVFCVVWFIFQLTRNWPGHKTPARSSWITMASGGNPGDLDKKRTNARTQGHL